MLSMKDAKILYKSSILPYVVQGSIFYGSANKDILQGLQTLQNSCLRTIYGKKDWPGTDRAHQDMRLMRIENRRMLNLMVYTHEQSFKLSNLRPLGTRTLRSSTKKYLKLDPPKSNIYKRSYVYKGITMWNMLGEDVKNMRNIKHYKTRVGSEIEQNKLNFPE